MSRSNHFIANARTVNVLAAGAKTANSFVADSETVNTLTANQVFPPYTFTDDFNRSDRDLDGDNGWGVTLGGIEISTNTAVASTYDESRIVRESNASDVTIKLDTIKRYTNASNRQWDCVIFRFIDNDNFFAFSYTADSSSLLRVADGSVLQVGGATGINVADGVPYSMSVVCVGDDIQCFINGTPAGDDINSFNQTETKHGFRVRTLGTPPGNAYVDNFNITEVRA